MINIKSNFWKIFLISSLIIVSCFFNYQELVFIENHNAKATLKFLKSELKNFNVTIDDEMINSNDLYKEHEDAYNNLIGLVKVENLEKNTVENNITESTENNDNSKEVIATLTATYNETKAAEEKAHQLYIAAKNSYAKRILSHYISNVPTYKQYPSYPNGCEGIALYILLKYYNVSVTPTDLFSRMPKENALYYENEILYGGNPYIGYVGNPENNTGFGVYEKPIITTANSFKAGIIDATGTPLVELLKIIRKNRPILVWATVNMNNSYPSKNWLYQPTGKTITWYANEHAMIIIGYNSTQIIVSDPINGEIRYFDRTTFESRYNFFGKRALYY